jgi:hypothetical protein
MYIDTIPPMMDANNQPAEPMELDDDAGFTLPPINIDGI